MEPVPPQQERNKSQMEGISEVNFLKDLYMFMKKRDTPIERIPHLGFKQIDLYLMYQAVTSLGGYEQVTAQQLWKQVYNTLGGNPRSTSAATCTRRHYEKLLLPYECHSKGITMKILPQLPQKSLQFLHYSRELESEGHRPLKRKILQIPLHQIPHHLQADPRSLAMHQHHTSFFHPNNNPLSPYAPIAPPSYCSPASLSSLTLPPLSINSESLKEPLQRLRYLSDQYKSWSGLSGPLNLVKSPEIESIPTSSFTVPPPSKNPKFLNTPYPLYSAQRTRLVANKPKDVETGEPVLAFGTPDDSSKYIIDLTSKKSHSCDSSQERLLLAKKPNSPKTDNKIQERPESPDVRSNDSLSSSPQQGTGRMEIEVPLSVFQKWLRLCGPAVTMQGLQQLQPLIPDEGGRHINCIENDLPQGNLTFKFNSKHYDESSMGEDLRIRKVPSPKSPGQVSISHYGGLQNHATSYKLSALYGFPKASYEVSHIDLTDTNKEKSSWTIFNKPSLSPLKLNSTDSQALLDLVKEQQSSMEASEKVPPYVYMGNSNSDPILQLTKDEVIKLKRMISSSM